MLRKLALCLSIGVLVTACGVRPTPIKPDETQTRIEEDLTRMYAEQEPLGGPLSLSEAMARALKYNLDHRVKLMENALAAKILDTHNYAMLPQLVAGAGYYDRSNYSGGVSQELIGDGLGEISLRDSTSQERSYHDAYLQLTWNILDFGVAHATAHQKANDILITLERRRRVMQNIMADVAEAYWEAVAAQRLLGEVDALLEETAQALDASRTLEQEAAQNPEAALGYQKSLLSSLRQLSRLREEMLLAKTRLAALINIPLSTQYQVMEPPAEEMPAELQISLQELEYLALLQQPELREEDYTVRNHVWEVKKAVRRLFPGLEISTGPNYNSNEYLYNSSWYSSSIRLTWNVLNVFTGGLAAKKEAEAHVELSKHRRMALGQAILSQVWVSYLRYQLARKDFQLSDEMYTVSNKLTGLADKAKRAKTRSGLDVTLVKVENLGARMTRDLAYANMQTALSKIYHSVGIDPLPEQLLNELPYSFENYDLAKLVELIEAHKVKNFQQYLQEVTEQVL